MNHRIVALALALALAAGAAQAYSNEAVRKLPDGRVEVELPPGPRTLSARGMQTPRSPWTSGALPSYVIQTSTGLQECPWQWVDGNCRPYVKGRDTRQRGWVVKRGGQWMTCPRRDVDAGCRGYYEFPATSVQD